MHSGAAAGAPPAMAGAMPPSMTVPPSMAGTVPPSATLPYGHHMQHMQQRPPASFPPFAHMHAHHHHHHHHMHHHHHQHHHPHLHYRPTYYPPGGAVPPPSGSVPPPMSTQRIVEVELGNTLPLPPSRLQTMFSPYGLLEKMTLKNTSEEGAAWVAYVTYSSSRGARRLLAKEKLQIEGKEYPVSISTQTLSGTTYDRPGLMLWVGLEDHDEIAQDDVGMRFAQLGNVQKVEIVEPAAGNRYALVTFCDGSVALRAHKEDIEIKGYKPGLEWYHPSEVLGTSLV